MWDWSPWQSLTDYGQKYDYGLFVLTPKGLRVFNEHNIGLPSQGWLAYMGKPVSEAVPERTLMIDPTPWVKEGQSMGGAGLSGRLTLTRGCVAAAWAITLAPMRGKVVLVGFDNVVAGTNKPIEESFSPDYWRLYNARFADKMDKVYPVGQPKTETHDMTIEFPLLQHLAYDCGISLELAQESWSHHG